MTPEDIMLLGYIQEEARPRGIDPEPRLFERTISEHVQIAGKGA